MSAMKIARVCHEANRAYCATLGDLSQLPWDDAPDWQVESAVKGVEMHLAGDFTAEQSHAAWMKHKAGEGWTHGPVKDPEKKQHPCMVPYDQLPVEQRKKDALFKAIIQALRG